MAGFRFLCNTATALGTDSRLADHAARVAIRWPAMLFPTVMEERWGECAFRVLEVLLHKRRNSPPLDICLCVQEPSRLVSYADHGWPPALPLGPVWNSVKAIAESLEIFVCPEPRVDLTEILLRINFHEAFALE
jgi:hypothetical protein